MVEDRSGDGAAVGCFGVAAAEGVVAERGFVVVGAEQAVARVGDRVVAARGERSVGRESRSPKGVFAIFSRLVNRWSIGSGIKTPDLPENEGGQCTNCHAGKH